MQLRPFLISVLHDRRRLTGIVMLVMTAGLVVAFMKAPTFTSSSTLLLLGSDAYGNQPIALSSQPAAPVVVMERDAILNAELSILTSPEIVREVMRELTPQRIYPELGAPGILSKLWQQLGWQDLPDPEKQAVEKALQRLKAAGDKHGGTITVTFSHADRHLAAQALMKILEAYQKRRATLYANTQSDLIATKVSEAKNQLQAAEIELAGYQAESGISDFQVQMELLLRRLSDLQRAEQAARSDSAETTRRVATLRTQLSTMAESIIQYSDSDIDKRAQAVRDSLADLKRQRAQLLETFTDKSQKVTVTQGQIDALEKELVSVLSSSKPSAVRRGPNEVRTSVELAFLRAGGESVSLEQRRRELTGQVVDVRAQVAALQDKHASFEALMRQKSLAEQVYLSSTRALQERKTIEEIEAKRVPNVRILTLPESPREPSRSRLAIAAAGVMLSLLVGLVAAVLGHQFRRTFIDPKRLEAELGMPVLACIDDRAFGDMAKLAIQSR